MPVLCVINKHLGDVRQDGRHTDNRMEDGLFKTFSSLDWMCGEVKRQTSDHKLNSTPLWHEDRSELVSVIT